MTIKHLSLTGGGPNVFIYYGVIKELIKNDFIQVDNIESIHCTSCGCIIAVFLLLLPKSSLDDIDDFLINKPWDKTFTVSPKDIIGSFTKLGMYDRTIIVEIVKPFFQLNDMDIDITLFEFYEKFKKKVTFYVSEVKFNRSECFNHLSNPDLKLVDAIYMSCSIPVIFRPTFLNDKVYVDGGLFKNYPLKDCIESIEDFKYDEIFGLKQGKIEEYNDMLERKYKNSEQTDEKNDDNSEDNSKHNSEDNKQENTVVNKNKNLDLFKFIIKIITNLIFYVNNINISQVEIKYEITVDIFYSDLDFWKKVLCDKDTRIELIKYGESQSKRFLEQYLLK